MTDARLPDRWLIDRRFNRLDDRDWRSYTYSLMWSVSNRTDGVIEESDLPLIPHFSRDSIPAFLAAEVWAVMDDRIDIAWRIIDYGPTQTSRAEHEVLDNARTRQRVKKQRQRARRRANTGVQQRDTSTGTVPGDTYPGTAQARQGKARQGTNRTHNGAETDVPDV